MATAMSSPTSLHIWADMILRGADDAEMILLSSAHGISSDIFKRTTFRRRFNSGNCYTQPPCYDGVYDVGIVAKIQKLLRQLKSRIGSADLWREYWKFLFVTPPSLSLSRLSRLSPLADLLILLTTGTPEIHLPLRAKFIRNGMLLI